MHSNDKRQESKYCFVPTETCEHHSAHGDTHKKVGIDWKSSLRIELLINRTFEK